RARVEGIVRRLQRARTQVHAAEAPATTPHPPPAEPRPREPTYGRADTLFFVVGGAAVAAAAVGGIFGVLALGNDADAEAVVSNGSQDLRRRNDLASTADQQALVADIALGGALVLGATAVLLYFLREEEGPR
ncbi:MAG: hypothetical protein L0206_25240, partial [Actinobacteria bacterium]|nr:hypothetical protein [Actinomycetota bacterium]